eukprot:scaffold61205_cov53-Attheya_sp.AAC.1
MQYSAGPLPEQQLRRLARCSSPRKHPFGCVFTIMANPIHGTSGPRVEALKSLMPVEIVKGFSGVGHCPHDEAPALVHPLLKLLEFLNRVQPKVISQTNDEEDDASRQDHALAESPTIMS